MKSQTAKNVEKLRLGAGAKVAVIAGNGQLPIDVTGELQRQGYYPFVVMIEGEADDALSTYDNAVLSLENLGRVFALLDGAGISHVILAGGISRRPSVTALRPSIALLHIAFKVAAALARGDDSLLRTLIGIFEEKGFSVIGAHEVVPDLLSQIGPMTRKKPSKAAMRDIEAAREAIRRLGPVDLGQAAIAVKGRVVAIEGPEGTDAVLARVKDLRSAHRLSATGGGVLVKCAKPGQELRVDLPTIGPETVNGAVSAGLAGIALEGGRAFILDYQATVSAAQKAGLFVYGLEPDAP